MNQSPVLQHEPHSAVRVSDLLRRPAIRREARLNCPYVLRRAPLPAFRVEMRWLTELCGDVDHRSQPAQTSTGNGATDSRGGLDLRFQCKVWRLVGREAAAVFLTVGCPR